MIRAIIYNSNNNLSCKVPFEMLRSTTWTRYNQVRLANRAVSLTRHSLISENHEGNATSVLKY